MFIKDLIEINPIRNKIKLDRGEDELIHDLEVKNIVEIENNSVNANEWFQEYEIIYKSYILEK